MLLIDNEINLCLFGIDVVIINILGFKCWNFFLFVKCKWFGINEILLFFWICFKVLV